MRSYAIALFSLMVACGSSSSAVRNDSGPCQYDMVRRNPESWLLTNPQVIFDYWGDFSQATPVLGDPFQEGTQLKWTWLFSGGVLSRLSEYGIHSGSLDVTYYSHDGSTQYVGDAGANILDDSFFASTINQEIQFQSLPYPGDNTLYIIMLPPGTSTQAMTNNNWNGYHRWNTYNGQRYTYAMIQYNGDVYTNVIISHEIYEAATDPDVSTGYSASQGEVGDLCEGDNVNVAGVIVQSVWSAVLCQCQ